MANEEKIPLIQSEYKTYTTRVYDPELQKSLDEYYAVMSEGLDRLGIQKEQVPGAMFYMPEEFIERQDVNVAPEETEGDDEELSEDVGEDDE
jgi:hypothetical protein